MEGGQAGLVEPLMLAGGGRGGIDVCGREVERSKASRPQNSSCSSRSCRIGLAWGEVTTDQEAQPADGGGMEMAMAMADRSIGWRLADRERSLAPCSARCGAVRCGGWD